MTDPPPSQTDKAAGPPLAELCGQLAELGNLTADLFDPHVGEVFRATYQQFEDERTHVQPLNVGTESETEVLVELKLVEVTRYPKLKEREGGFDQRSREPFALLFAGPPDPLLLSAEHTIRHEQLGTGRLFLNSVQATEGPANPNDGRFYEATFS